MIMRRAHVRRSVPIIIPAAPLEAVRGGGGGGVMGLRTFRAGQQISLWRTSTLGKFRD